MLWGAACLFDFVGLCVDAFLSFVLFIIPQTKYGKLSENENMRKTKNSLAHVPMHLLFSRGGPKSQVPCNEASRIYLCIAFNPRPVPLSAGCVVVKTHRCTERGGWWRPRSVVLLPTRQAGSGGGAGAELCA